MTEKVERFAVLPLWVLQINLTETELRVLIALYSFRSKGAMEIWPSRESIAARAGIADSRRVSRVTSRLCKKGLIRKSRRNDARGNVYELCSEKRSVAAESADVEVDDSYTSNESEVHESYTRPQSEVHESCTSQVYESCTSQVYESCTRIEETNELTNELTNNYIKNGNLHQKVHQPPMTKNKASEIQTTGPPERKTRNLWFEKFWSIYPRRVGKQAAQAKFDKSVDTPEKFERVIRALTNQLATDRFNGPMQFIPHPATWLNQGRWSDDINALNHEVDRAKQNRPDKLRSPFERLTDRSWAGLKN